ncbi:hypothetical protein ACFLU4_02080 [Chloroflexota bacterium]
MYQIQVKRALVDFLFPIREGWQVTVNLDGMELGKGNQNSEAKYEIADKCKKWFESEGIVLGPHPKYRFADIVASKGTSETHIIEVEGESSKQSEQALYSALGQIIIQMDQNIDILKYGLAVPDDPKWEKHLKKIPIYIRGRLDLQLYLVSETGVRLL